MAPWVGRGYKKSLEVKGLLAICYTVSSKNYTDILSLTGVYY